MKKILLTIVALTLICSYSFAKEGMRTFPLSSDIYTYMDNLYLLEGKAAPRGARPWTRSTVVELLDAVSPSSQASETIAEAIREIADIEEDGEKTLRVYATLNPQAGIHTNKSFNRSDLWAYPVMNAPLARLGGELYLNDIFSMQLSLTFEFANSLNIPKEPGKAPEWQEIYNPQDRFKEIFSTNIPFVSEGGINADFTTYATSTIGNDYFSATVARDQISWGNGMHGNLILGNTLPYHDYVNLHADNNSWFSFDTIVSFFSHPMNYDRTFLQQMDGLNFFLGHRFEFRFLQDKLRVSMNEAIMYQSKENHLDFRVLNPLLVMHGFYIPYNANSMFSAELEAAIMKNLQFYASFVIDDLAVAGERQPPEASSTPNSWGVLGGLRSTYPMNEGYFNTSFEMSYITPLTYHRRTGDHERDAGIVNDHSLDYIGSIRFFKNNSTFYDRRYLSLPFGSDSLAATLDFSYTVPRSWSAGSRFFFLAHGITDVNSEIYLHSEGDESLGWLATKNPFDGSEGEISYTFDLGFHGSYEPIDSLRLSIQTDFIYVLNFKHQKGNAFDMQTTIGLTYTLAN